MSIFRYQSDLPHQVEAVDHVVGLFEGLERGLGCVATTDGIVGNVDVRAHLEDAQLEANLNRIRGAHNDAHPEAPVPVTGLVYDDGAMLEGVSEEQHACPHFTVEMETGTGKTYVYLRTMLELHRRHGFTKFIVVVPSVAILEGVKAAFDDTTAHFHSVFGVTHVARMLYDGGRPDLVPAFARSAFPTLLIMTQQSFNRAANKLYHADDRVISELRPFEWIARTRPVVMLDEPQNMASERSKQALRTLRPLVVLRYSATHRPDERPNLVYRLTPRQAASRGLVKRVHVTGVVELGLAPRSTMRLIEVTRRPLRAKVRALCVTADAGLQERELAFAAKDHVFETTGLAEHEGLTVASIHAAREGRAAAVELEGGHGGGRTITSDDPLPGSSAQAWRVQLEEMIRSHFVRQREMRAHGVKVLSLIFIDRVANYVAHEPRIKTLFDACFDELKKSEPDFQRFDASEVRAGYFARQQKARDEGADTFLDVVKPDSEEARRTFALIMRDKQVLLTFPNEDDPRTKVAFVFAHSALREGWDNPNVFQICTLNQTVSVMRKRQELGRGLRLCVDQRGRRITDPALNVLTLIANESYDSYVRALQTEYVDAGEEAPAAPARQPKVGASSQGSAGSRPKVGVSDSASRPECGDTFAAAGDVVVDSEVVVEACVARINDIAQTSFSRPTLSVSRGRFVVGEAGRSGVVTEVSGHAEEPSGASRETRAVPDFVGRAAEESLLTRATVWRIFRGVSDAQKCTLREFPEAWASTFVRAVVEVTLALRPGLVAPGEPRLRT